MKTHFPKLPPLTTTRGNFRNLYCDVLLLVHLHYILYRKDYRVACSQSRQHVTLALDSKVALFVWKLILGSSIGNSSKDYRILGFPRSQESIVDRDEDIARFLPLSLACRGHPGLDMQTGSASLPIVVNVLVC